MAKNSSIKEVSLDLVRELLIAIPQSVPEKLGSKSLSEIWDCLNGDVLRNENNSEELRSEMISMSRTISPDSVLLQAMSTQEVN